MLPVFRQAVARRAFSSTTRTRAVGANLYGAEFQAERQKVEEHAAHSADLWRRMTYYVALPLCAVMAVHIYNIEAAHKAHREHLKEENGGELPERKRYPHLGKHDKDFVRFIPGVPTRFVGTLFTGIVTHALTMIMLLPVFNPEVNIPAPAEE